MLKSMSLAGRSGLRLAALLCFLQTIAHAQPTAAFGTTSSRSGCSPLVVAFSDSSTGNPTQWRWDLGNGVVSLLRNPSSTYFNPGTYTVKLVVRNASGADSVTKVSYVTVFSDPTPAFAASRTAGCFPLRVDFTDGSTPGTGNLSSWVWDFGDGNTSTEQNPQHEYTTAGNFTVTLQARNSVGCTRSVTKTALVNVAAGITASFSNTQPGACAAPAAVGFTNTSTGPAPLSFAWAFGDGATSTQQNPTHTYAANGAYSVQLVVTSMQGCTDTVRKQNLINIGTPTVSFLAPDTVCAGEPFPLTNTSQPAPVSNNWSFGNGTFSTQTNPVATYASPGTYIIKLKADFGGCADSITKQILVAAKPQPAFTSAATSVCSLPASVQFINQTTGSGSFVWEFGDGTSDTARNPLHVYLSAGSYTVRLTVTNAAGCTTTITRTNFVTVQPPQVTVNGLPRSGCSPITITPTAFIAAPQTITSYLWKFGDGTTSTQATPSHTYIGTGTYTIKLLFTTSSGCTDSVIVTDAVRVGTKPSAAFSLQPNDVCAFRAVSFFDNSTGTADAWFWTFGDGSTSTLQNPTHEYSDTGWFNVQLVVYNNTCPDTLRINRAVHIKPPIANFLTQNSCTDKYTKTFRDASIGATSWHWVFGDGTTSAQRNPVHTYALPGRYSVTLTVSNDTCSHSSTQTILVIDEKARFAADSTVCRNSTAIFTSAGINAANVISWQWAFGDGNSTNTPTTASHVYRVSGSYTVTLIITDVLGCADTTKQMITVYGPTADFTVSAGVACLYQNRTTFTDASSSDGRHPIQRREWNYGDGTIDSSGLAPFQHSYSAAGTYTVTLLVKDSYGCTDVATKPAAVAVVQPKADFYSPDTATCTGKAVSFVNTSTGSNLQPAWTFGDGKSATDVNPVHAYGAVGIYNVKLVVTDSYGCKDSVLKPAYIAVSFPKARLLASDTFSTCPPLLVHFSHRSTDYTSLQWDFGDGTASILDSPAHFYTAAGTYKAVLTVTGPGGCTDRAEQLIVIKGPSGSFSYAPLSGCRPLAVNFTAVARGIATYTWDFADGNIVVTSDSLISHVYNSAGDFLPRLILTDAGGCSVPVQGPDTIRIKGISARFAMGTSDFCDGGTVQFSNTTVGNDLITGYKWDFGDGATSLDQHPSHYYAAPGVYTVTLAVTSQSGCVDSVRHTDTVKVFASPVVSIQQDSSGCVPLTVRFNGNVTRGDVGSMTWDWNFGNGNTASDQSPVAQVYTVADTYNVSTVVTDNHGCRDTATGSVTAHPLPVVNAGPDVWICRGSAASLSATGAATYVWNPTPSLSCTSCASPLAAPTDSTQYGVTGTSGFGCVASDSVIVRVHQPFTLQVGTGDTVCAGSPVFLRAVGADKYTWIPSTAVANPAAGNTTANPMTTTTYKVVAQDNAGCFTDTGSVHIKVWPYPLVEAGADKTIGIGQSVLLQPSYSNDIVSYQWSNPQQTLSCTTCPAPTAITKTVKQTYAITVVNEGGCTSRDEVTVFAICNSGNLFIPNTFTPNGDGKNDVFFPRGSGVSRIRSLRIYNRWGESVFYAENFAANDPAFGWDGRYKGLALTPDVYVYTCEVVCLNNELLIYQGNVTLLK